MAYTNIDDPSAYFQVETYTGNSTSPRTVTLSGNSDMQPDWTWIKTRTGAYYHYLFDSSRTSGSSYYRLVSSENFAESVDSVSQLTAFTTDGFTLTGSGSMANVNWNTQNYVAWNWKANGGTTASNTDGSITSTVQANTDAGFSIVTYTGNGTQTGQTVGHGLGAVPKMIISKERASLSNVPTWRVYHEAIGNTKYLTLNSTEAAGTFNDWDNTTPTSSVYSVGGAGGYTPTNSNTRTYVAYVFAEKQGYSKFGKYVGNANVNGAFVYTGFKPAFIMTKRTDTTGNWLMYDNKRIGHNPNNYELYANLNNVEEDNDRMDILSNGFKMRLNNADSNASGGTYIYMAFAENPFTTSTGIPTTAR